MATVVGEGGVPRQSGIAGIVSSGAGIGVVGRGMPEFEPEDQLRQHGCSAGGESYVSVFASGYSAVETAGV